MVVLKKIVFKQWVYNVPKQTLCYILHQIAKNVLEISIWGTNISRIPISKFSIFKDNFFFFFWKNNKIKLFIFSHHPSFIKSCPQPPWKDEPCTLRTRSLQICGSHLQLELRDWRPPPYPYLWLSISFSFFFNLYKIFILGILFSWCFNEGLGQKLVVSCFCFVSVFLFLFYF